MPEIPKKSKDDKNYKARGASAPQQSKDDKSYKGYSGPAPEKAAEAKPYEGHATPASNSSRSTIMIIIAVMLVLIVIAAGVLIFLFMSSPFVSPPPQQTPPVANVTANLTNTTAVQCDDQCMLQNAVESGSADLCLNISDMSLRQSCYMMLSNTSVSVCLDLTNETDQVKCVSDYAVDDGNVSLCSLLSEPGASACMAAVNPCYADNGSAQLLCFAPASKNYSICGSDEECILNYSRITGTIDACNQLPLVADQYGCWAEASHMDECANLSIKSQEDLCYDVYAMQTGNSQLCQNITPDNLYQTQCLSYFAVKLGDYKICNEGLAIDNRWNCYINYSLATGDRSGCDAIDPLAGSAEFTCYYDYAIQWGNPSVCGEFAGDPDEMAECFIGAMVTNNTKLNYSYCADINVTSWQNQCYDDAAMLYNDSSICSYLTDQNDQDSCLADLNITLNEANKS